MNLSDAQRELLEDKFLLWERASREGAAEYRDYNRRAAEALKTALAIASASPSPPEGQGELYDELEIEEDEGIVTVRAYRGKFACTSFTIYPDKVIRTDATVNGSPVSTVLHRATAPSPPAGALDREEVVEVMLGAMPDALTIVGWGNYVGTSTAGQLARILADAILLRLHGGEPEGTGHE